MLLKIFVKTYLIQIILKNVYRAWIALPWHRWAAVNGHVTSLTVQPDLQLLVLSIQFMQICRHLVSEPSLFRFLFWFKTLIIKFPLWMCNLILKISSNCWSLRIFVTQWHDFSAPYRETYFKVTEYIPFKIQLPCFICSANIIFNSFCYKI